MKYVSRRFLILREQCHSYPVTMDGMFQNCIFVLPIYVFKVQLYSLVVVVNKLVKGEGKAHDLASSFNYSIKND
jgi:hypothetical protein